MVRWNSRAVFVEHAVRVHGDRYNYDEVTDDLVKGAFSKVPLTCNVCGYKWSPTISSHINCKSGCIQCAGKTKWTLDRFLCKAHETHGTKFYYGSITENDIKNVYSKISLSCNTCNYQWSPTIDGHINQKNGCPSCAGNAKLTLSAVLHRAYEIHGTSVDHSMIREYHINGKDSKIPLKCNTCGYSWCTTISCHINGKYGCPQCAGHLRLTLDFVLRKARKVHGDKYDYGLVNHTHINGAYSRIPVKCDTCQYQWSPVINDHINSTRGCPNCSLQKSKGEIAVTEMLESLKSVGMIHCYFVEYRYYDIPEIASRSVDFVCYTTRHDGSLTCIFIEYDGKQHFEEIKYFTNDLATTQNIDIQKTFLPLEKWPGACMLRINYKLYPQTRQIINEVIEYVKTDPTKRLYLYSKYDDYDHLLDSDLNKLTHTEIHYESTYGRE